MRRPDGTVEEVLREPWNARTAVHEYGGGAWWVRDGVVWFADWSTQRLHRLDAVGDLVPLTPEPAVPRGLRYADGDVSPDGSTVLCIQEEHHATGEVVNTIVRLDATDASTPEAVVVGPDFVSNPRWRADGGAFCWLEWDHPAMPWDATRLVIDVAGERTVVAGGAGTESVVQPEWAPDGSLWFSSDRTGFWSLYRWTPDGRVETMADVGRDIGFPAWTFGTTCHAFLDGGRVAFVFVDDGMDRLAVRMPDGAIERLDVPYTVIDGLTATGATVRFIAASPTAEPHVVAIDIDGSEAGEPVVVVPPRGLPFGDEWFSVPEPVDFPTGGGETAHALLYRPRNPDVHPPAGDRPPALVVIHGGPTSAARPMLKLGYQYWTSRGFAVVDVNHRGSTGYGRAYRDLLQGQWGVVDVEDCAAVCRYLAARGDVDPARLCIRGGSAGGFTTLMALANEDVFAAGASYYGVADLAALAADTHKFESRYLDGLIGPWPDAADVYAVRSPINHIDGIDRPLIVFQGLEDMVVPPAQSEMIIDALRAKGVHVSYLTFAGEQHGFRQAATIRTALDAELAFYLDVLGIT
jgi:dipeptidyl aminopeptidase/acylaminoacyl peptidase